MVTYRFRPFAEIDTLREQLNRMFEPGSSCTPDSQRAWAIPLELTETPTQYRLRALLPGFNPDAIEVEATGKVLTISAELAPRELEKEEVTHLKEFRYGKLSRSLEFAEDILSDQIQAAYQHGILTLEIPKRDGDRHKPVKIEIKG